MTELTEEQKLSIREANKKRKRQQRERDKQKRIRALEAQKAATERGERMGRNLHFFGECSPGRNATTFEDEVHICREFLRALGQSDVQPNETLRAMAERTYGAWVAGPFTSRGHDGTTYVPGFNRTTQQFDPDFGFVLDGISFEECWTPPKDCADEPIDVNSLPKLPTLKKDTKPADTVPEPPPPPSTPAPVPYQQPDAITFAWLPPTARNFMVGSDR